MARSLRAGLKGEQLYRGRELLDNCGDNIADDIVDALLKAAEQSEEKVEAVLAVLEEHWEDCLKRQPLALRGKMLSSIGGNPTKLVFERINTEILGFKQVVE